MADLIWLVLLGLPLLGMASESDEEGVGARGWVYSASLFLAGTVFPPALAAIPIFEALNGAGKVGSWAWKKNQERNKRLAIEQKEREKKADEDRKERARLQEIDNRRKEDARLKAEAEQKEQERIRNLPTKKQLLEKKLEELELGQRMARLMSDPDLREALLLQLDAEIARTIKAMRG